MDLTFANKTVFGLISVSANANTSDPTVGLAPRKNRQPYFEKKGETNLLKNFLSKSVTQNPQKRFNFIKNSKFALKKLHIQYGSGLISAIRNFLNVPMSKR